jgi:hypothetical protein
MGFKFTQAAFNCTKAGGLDKLVLWIICEHASEQNDSEAWPSIRTIGREAGICKQSTVNAIHSLEALGLITIARTKITTKAGGELNLVNRYKPNLEAIRGGAPDALGGGLPDSPPWSTRQPTLVHEIDHGGLSDGTEPVIEPVTEPVREPFSQSVSKSVSYERGKDKNFKDPDTDPQWLEIMADPRCAELYDQVGVHGGLALAMGLDYFGDEHVPMLQQLTRWASIYGKDVKYLKGIWLWSQGHKFWKTRVLGLDSMVKAMGNQTEKGLVAQYNRAMARKQDKNKNGHAPLWVHKKQDDGSMVRSLGRKPVTTLERDELIEVLEEPKINREYVLGFLVQDNCPECRGMDIGCECALTPEVLPEPPVAPAPRAAAAGSNFGADEL